MCGIFGLAITPDSTVSQRVALSLLEDLYILSESRGKESAGLHVYAPCSGNAMTLRGALSASEFLKTPVYRLATSEISSACASDGQLAGRQSLAVLAHSRLVTNGAAEIATNNQPVRFRGVTVVHNGIVVNADNLWSARPHLHRSAEVDTEVLAAYLADELEQCGDAALATSRVFSTICGSASVAWVHDALDCQVLATNTGDLYFSQNPDLGVTVFASERYILQKSLVGLLGTEDANIQWLQPGTGALLNIKTGAVRIFDMRTAETIVTETVTRRTLAAEHHDLEVSGVSSRYFVTDSNADYSLLRFDVSRLRGLRRCTCCVLPETFPFIDFDDQGVCNYCRNYQPRYKGLDPRQVKQDFISSIEHYRRDNGQPDVLVPFSGGRDSSFGLHLIKKEFGLNPITFTYDWGMVTDLARRNIARLCGQLGVQNILVSADIQKKRENIRKNVTAWLKSPDLGMIPLFMAGDKHFFSIVNTLKKQTGIRLDLWCANPLENTDFKSGFCGVSPDFGKKRLDYLSFTRKARLAAYFGTRFLLNPGYLNDSLLDTASAFFAYYFEPRRDFYFVFNHMVWDEDEVNHTLLNEYDWELASDTSSTWRIGDGTAAFYNYIYVSANGFSEFDTFRSNQIREGVLSRERALALILEENRPRPQSIRWYLDAIGLDFDSTIRRINELAPAARLS